MTVKAARTIADRLAASLGEAIETPFAGLSRTFPLPDRICSLEPPIEDRLGPLGVTSARARSMIALARALSSGAIVLIPGGDPNAAMARLARIPGFGPRTVQYVAMRALGWPDAFLAIDHGVKRGLLGVPTKKRAAMAEGWRPWWSYATVTLWSYLTAMGMAKE